MLLYCLLSSFYLSFAVVVLFAVITLQFSFPLWKQKYTLTITNNINILTEEFIFYLLPFCLILMCLLNLFTSFVSTFMLNIARSGSSAQIIYHYDERLDEIGIE